VDYDGKTKLEHSGEVPLSPSLQVRILQTAAAIG
jgi:hypothetical protein